MASLICLHLQPKCLPDLQIVVACSFHLPQSIGKVSILKFNKQELLVLKVVICIDEQYFVISSEKQEIRKEIFDMQQERTDRSRRISFICMVLSQKWFNFMLKVSMFSILMENYVIHPLKISCGCGFLAQSKISSAPRP